MNSSSNNKFICTDANSAVAKIAYLLSDFAGIYPITPSSVMAEYADELASQNLLNVFGNKTRIVEMQSEAGAAGAIHGALSTGALATTFTASQGLLLMIPNMYKLASEKLPAVFHVSARAIATHALSIFGDHSDVMACRQTGFLMIASDNAQQAQDYALASHLIAIKASLPVLHFFDGFRTSHEINKIEEISIEDIKSILPIKEIAKFRANSHNPNHPKQTGTAQNPDIFFQNTIASLPNYEKAKNIIHDVFNQISKLTCRNLQVYEYYGDTNATNVIITMGSSFDTCKLAVDKLNKLGQHTGVLCVHVYRPFIRDEFVNSLSKSVNKITVLDRTKEQGSIGEPLYLDVIAALEELKIKNINVYSGIYGLGSKEFLPKHVDAIFKNMQANNPINHFTVGIDDDVSHTSLKVDDNFKIDEVNNLHECLFFGLGSDGTVSANKNSIKIIGNNTNKYIQGYFEYDSKKSGSLTISHLRFANEKFQMPYYVYDANFIGIHNYAIVNICDCLKNLKPYAKVLLNTTFSDEQLAKYLPQIYKGHLKQANAELYTIDANKLAVNCGLKNRINTIMQVCFFKLANIIDEQLAISEIKKYAITSYTRKGQDIVDANLKAIDLAQIHLHKADLNLILSISTIENSTQQTINKYFNTFIKPINSKEGDSLPVSMFSPNGQVPTGTSQYEKRKIASLIPTWIPENCIQCGQCTMVCPHAVMRPYLLNEKENNDKPLGLKTTKAIGIDNTYFVMQPSPLDCTGCQVCAHVCPSQNKALVMKPIEKVINIAKTNYDYLQTIIPNKPHPFKPNTIKGAQFLKPYFEFSGACAGCGETPYIRLLTQLFGKYMIIANATGCSSIYGGSAPSCPYTYDEQHMGPSWGNSLFENNAEYGYGMYLAIKDRRNNAYQILDEIKKLNLNGDLNHAIDDLITHKDEPISIEKTKILIDLLKHTKSNQYQTLIDQAINSEDLYAKKSIWIIGGDGWAYDIGFGGLDHVLASGENVNILILDTEVYSNTGGQSSKSTPAGAVTKFATSGKNTNKKDLGMMAMTYKNVYVAQVAMGANQQQILNALTEAESYDGPSIVICYAACINHGIDMSNSQLEEKRAVQSGYWNLYRYDPRKEKPMTIDSLEPTIPYEDFLKGEARYASLFAKNESVAKTLAKKAQESSAAKRDSYKHINDELIKK